MHRNKSVDVHQFAMVPRADIPRSSFRIETAHKTTFDSGLLIPIFLTEVLPGDSFSLRMTAFARLATPIFPIMDNMTMDSFFFFVPNRLVWTNWVKFMGEQDNPGDSTSFLLPEISSPVGGYLPNTIGDYFGLPTVGQVGAAATFSGHSLPFRCYNLIYNQWFRDENLQDSVPVPTGDGPDNISDFVLLRRGKRHDYFTSALPWPQKGASVSLPLGTSAPIGYNHGAGVAPILKGAVADNPIGGTTFATDGAGNLVAGVGGALSVIDPNGTLYADLSAATAATINQLRQSFQIQKLLERDARGGTRYTELVRAHFGVVSPDARLQRPEYLGGGSTRVVVNPVAQTSGTPGAGGYTDTPQGNLAAVGTAVAAGHGFTQSFTEHGHIIGLICVRADLNYQQGVRRMWQRSTKYDFYFPAFAALGEQVILNQEIYCDGSAADKAAFGYIPRWDEYRYHPSMITGLFRSTTSGTLDAWHLAQHFSARPTLASEFIQENPPVQRVVAVPSQPQFIFDSFFSINAARPMPMHSVPGLIDHF